MNGPLLVFAGFAAGTLIALGAAIALIHAEEAAMRRRHRARNAPAPIDLAYARLRKDAR